MNQCHCHRGLINEECRWRIDGIVALIMGLERATAYQESVYNTRGPYFLTMDDDWVEAGE